MLAAILLIRSVSVPGTGLAVNLATHVGAPFDAATVARDVRWLWFTGRFRDVRVETAAQHGGTDVVFRVTPEPVYPLREVSLRPNPFGLRIELPPGTPVSQRRADELAAAATRQLKLRGYTRAKAVATLPPAGGGKVDVVLDLAPGEQMRLKPVGDASLRAPRWYSREAVESHAARLRAHYAAAGYFDARVSAREDVEAKRVVVDFRVEPGRLYQALDMHRLCGCLFTERRAAERAGVLDFDATVGAGGAWSVSRGRAYTVGRIRFLGNLHYSDASIRRHFLLDEAAPLDSWRLRQSIVRLNRAGWFEPLDEHGVHIATDERTGIADVTVHVVERRRGAWNLSGPLPLVASVSARLPLAATYTAGFQTVAYSMILKLVANRRVLPVFSLARPFTPGTGWFSGFAFAP
ncbi:MAG: hypothetical protein KGN36_03680, partial [Acidobacteriota bacterium]|nr:hypothetical protein [Acidobacteriota bacterium]